MSGHIPANMRAEEAVDAGYDEIQHANMLFLNFMPDVKDTRTPARFTAVAERGADLDLSSSEVRAFIEKLRSRGIVVDPTVAVFEGLFTARTGSLAPSYAMIAERMPPQVRRGFLTGGLPEAGKLADFILVDGDPTKDISDIRRVVTIVKDGRVYDARAIYAELGIR
ncbi:MAG TPA: hypothetical protein VNA69_20990 [Thermoanaerobaculia bacterium]|nr:hypothetical protein [Thermoanaerobaculia bacterium]